MTPVALFLFGEIVSTIMLSLKTFTDVKTPSQHPKTRILSKCEDFFSKNHLKMLENSRFEQLGDRAGIDFVRKNRLVNYVATIY